MPAGMLMCIQEYSENIKRATCDIQTLKTTLVVIVWVFCVASLLFLSESTALLLSHWGESGLSPSLLTGKSVSCWRWKDCGLFNRENRATSPPLLPVSSALQSHTTTHVACTGGVLSDFTTMKIKSWRLLFKVFKCIGPAVSVEANGVWQARGSCWKGPCQYV